MRPKNYEIVKIGSVGRNEWAIPFVSRCAYTNREIIIYCCVGSRERGCRVPPLQSR